MKNILAFLITIFVCSTAFSQQNNRTPNFGKKAAASIHLVDSELVIAKDGTNSVLRFEITNNSAFPIYVARPDIKNGTVPQYFNLVNSSVECIQEDAEMIARNSSEFTLIPAKSTKQFELDQNFYQLSCIGSKKPTNANLVYRAFNVDHQDSFLAVELLTKDRDSRDIIEYILTSSLKSAPIKIIYQ